MRRVLKVHPETSEALGVCGGERLHSARNVGEAEREWQRERAGCSVLPGRWLDPKPADTTAERRKRDLVPVGVLGIALDGILKPRSEPNIGSTGRGASRATRTGRTSPRILCRVDATGADA